MREESARTLAEMSSIVSRIFATDNVCYRGQADYEWALVPSAFRAFIELSKSPNFEPLFAADIERDTYREFELAAHRELRSSSIFERLSIAQHHGVPTRLLDWTLNLSVATYFAACSGSSKDGAVWALNLARFPFPAELGRQLPQGGFTIEKINYYSRGYQASFAQPVSKPVYNAQPPLPAPPQPAFVMWKPARADERLQRQEGLMSWSHTFDDGQLVWNYSDHITELEKSINHDLLLKIKIQDDYKDYLLVELTRLGITRHYLFADLDGLGQYLAWEHQRRINEECA